MKNFIKNNSVLVAGVALPFLLIVVFAIANLYNYKTAEDPKYDFIFSEKNYESYNNNQSINYSFAIESEKLNVTATKNFNYNGNYKQKLFRYNAKTNTVSEIVLPTVQFEEDKNNSVNNTFPTNNQTNQPNGVAIYKPVKITIPELENLKFNSTTTSPDGYTFSPYSYDRDGGLMFEVLFSGRNGYYGCTLRKFSRIIKIPQDKCRNYQNEFVGWIVE